MLVNNLKNYLQKNWQILAIASSAFLLHLIISISGGYGYFRDELYYIACAKHLDWGYVDHPPFSILILRGVLEFLGDSIIFIRLLPSLIHAIVIYFTALIATELGGGSYGKYLSAISLLFAPVLLAISDFYSMNSFEFLFLTVSVYIILKIINTGSAKYWIIFWIVSGLGIENKYSMIFFLAAVFFGIILTGHFKLVFNKWFLIGLIILFIITLPNFLWQMKNDFPSLEFLKNASSLKNFPMSPVEFLSAQVLFQHPVALPIWITGIFALMFYKPFNKYRFFAIAFIILIAYFIFQRGKPYYLSPGFPMIVAAGAITIEQFSIWIRQKWILPVYIGFLSITGIFMLPLFIPILPIKEYIKYSETIGLRTPKMEVSDVSALPQYFADRFGWREMVSKVAEVYKTLPENEQKNTLLYCRNYGEAGAIDFFGPEYGLPMAISGHNNYWLWLQNIKSFETVIIIGGKEEDHRKSFRHVQSAGLHDHPYSMSFERNLTIYICKNPKITFQEIKARVKLFI